MTENWKQPLIMNKLSEFAHLHQPTTFLQSSRNLDVKNISNLSFSVSEQNNEWVMLNAELLRIPFLGFVAGISLCALKFNHQFSQGRWKLQNRILTRKIQFTLQFQRGDGVLFHLLVHIPYLVSFHRHHLRIMKSYNRQALLTLQ